MSKSIANSTLAIGGVSCSSDTFVLAESSVHRAATQTDIIQKEIELTQKVYEKYITTYFDNYILDKLRRI